jgi:hypothetical protein
LWRPSPTLNPSPIGPSVGSSGGKKAGKKKAGIHFYQQEISSPGNFCSPEWKFPRVSDV